MIYLNIKILKFMVFISGYALSEFKEGAKGQSDINEMVSMRNWAIRELKTLGV